MEQCIIVLKENINKNNNTGKRKGESHAKISRMLKKNKDRLDDGFNSAPIRRIIQQKNQIYFHSSFQSPFTYPLSILYCLSLYFALSMLRLFILIFQDQILLIKYCYWGHFSQNRDGEGNKTLLHNEFRTLYTVHYFSLWPRLGVFRIALIVLAILF